MLRQNRISDVREFFVEKLQTQDFVVIQKKNGSVKTLDMVGHSFLADEPAIFGEPTEYIERELAWYRSQSLNVNDIPGPVPEIWKRIADQQGFINSNYGWCVWSPENYNQLANVIKELSENRYSRRAQIIYNRPSMWLDYNKNGRDDFICTNAVTYFVRGNVVHANVQMRSNDGIFGFKNDWAWQLKILMIVADALGLNVGEITWNAATLHIYENHFYLVDHYAKTGEITVTKKKYCELYPESPYSQKDYK